MKHRLFFLLTILILISCQDQPMWFDNQYVFLEQHKSIHSELIKGFCPHMCVDFPTYIYYPKTKELYGSIRGDYDPATDKVTNNKLTDKTIMLLGMGESHSGDASSGAGTGLVEVHNLPQVEYNLTVKSIGVDGTVHFTYKDSSMVLAPDHEWSVIWTKSDTFVSEYEDWDNLIQIDWDTVSYANYTTEELDSIMYYSQNPRPVNDTTIIQWTYTDRITNWGLLEKKQFGSLEDLWGE